MERLVTEILPVSKKQSMVCLDSGERFPLYSGELGRYQITEGKWLTEKDYAELISVLKKRTRLRCLHLLQKMDRTQAQLEQKLKEGGYPPFLIEDALEYAKSFHYIDDERYARQYAEQYSSRKSRRQLTQELLRRGISPEVIQTVLEESTIDETATVQKLARKKAASVHPCEESDWQKVCRYLAGKGFGYDVIKQTVEQLKRETEQQDAENGQG